jgi:hypothetical protein
MGGHEMKKLFYRLASSRWFARSLSILAFAALGLYDPSASFATVYCKDNSPNTACRAFAGSVCPPTSTSPYNAYTVKCSTSGGTTATGSVVTSVDTAGDNTAGLSQDENNNPTSVCGPPYLDLRIDTTQAVSCTYTGDFGPNKNVPQQANCFFKNVVCPCNLPGACEGGIRESVATGPIVINNQNVVGCVGTLEVIALNGTPLRQGTAPSCTGIDRPGGAGGSGSAGCDLEIGKGNAGLTSIGKFQKFYPGTSEFDKLVASKITHACTSTSTPKDENILEFSARSTNFNTAAETVFVFAADDIQPADGFPAHSCTNAGITHITFAPQGSDVCSTTNYFCGQDPSGVFGPNPSTAGPATGQSAGLCEVTCPKCNEATGLTLANPGVGGQGLYYLFSTTSDNAYESEIEISAGP